LPPCREFANSINYYGNPANFGILGFSGGGGAGLGGAIFNMGTLSISGSSLVENIADGGQGGPGAGNGQGLGGAIFNDNGTVTVSETNLTNNIATRGAGIDNAGDGAETVGPVQPGIVTLDSTVQLNSTGPAYAVASQYADDTTNGGLTTDVGPNNLIENLPATTTPGQALTLMANFDGQGTAPGNDGLNDLWQVSNSTGQTVVTGQQLNFNFANSAKLPDNLFVNNPTNLIADVTFQTTTAGILLGYQNAPLGITPTNYVPALYVDVLGYLHGEFYNGTINPIQTGVKVNDGKLHDVVLEASRNTQTLYLDGQEVGSLTGTIQPLDMTYAQFGNGYEGYPYPTWPNANGGFDGFIDTIDRAYIANDAVLEHTVVNPVPAVGDNQLNFMPTAAGTYTITLQGMTSSGTTIFGTGFNGYTAGVSTTSQTVTVANIPPTPTILGLPAASVPAGSPITLRATATDPSPIDAAGGYTYTWQVTDSSGKTTASTATGSQALSFNGLSQYVNLGNPSELNISGDITLEAWIKPGSTGGLQDIVVHGYQLSPFYAEDYLRINNGYYEVGSWDGSDAFAEAPIPAGDVGQWVNLAGVYNGQQWLLYRDGILVAASGPTSQGAVSLATGTSAQGYGPSDWAIGAAGDGGERFFQGQVADAGIWSVARAAAGVISDMARDIPANQAGLVAYYQFGQASGGTVVDVTGNGNNGTLGGPNPSQAPTLVPGIAPGSVLTFTPPDSGTYTLSLTATDSNGLSAATTSTINVSDVAPTPSISGLAGGSVPVGSPISLSASASDPASAVNAAGYQYLWQATNAAGQTTIAGNDLVLTGNNPVTLPSGLISGINTSFTIDVSFTTTYGGVILGYQDSALGTTPANWVPALYVGTDGHLYGEIFNGTLPLQSTAFVKDGKEHSVELSYVGGVETLKLDGTTVGTLNSPLEPLDMSFDQLGTGWTTNWQAGNAGPDPFVGTIQSVVISNNSGAVGTWAFPGTNGSRASFTPYDVGTDTITLLAADKNGGTGAISAPLTVTEVAPTPTIVGEPASSVAARTPITLSSSISIPSPVAAAAGFNQVWEVDGAAGKTVIGEALNFNGNNPMTLSPDLFNSTTVTIQLTFQTTKGGVLLGYQGISVNGVPESYEPAIYVGGDGRLYAQLFAISAPTAPPGSPTVPVEAIDPIRTTNKVNDGKVHTVELVVSAKTQTLTLDGTAVGTLRGNIQPVAFAEVTLGTGYTAGWAGGNGGFDAFSGTIGQLSITNGTPPAGILSLAGTGGNQVTFIGPDPETFTVKLRVGDKNGGTGVATTTITTTAS
jgi:hypothetical protein